jgi:hypothetical protein
MADESFDPKGHFTKVGEDDYIGPSGKHFNYNQVRLYYSAKGWENVEPHGAEGFQVSINCPLCRAWMKAKHQ